MACYDISLLENDWTEVQPFKMNRAYGSYSCISSVGTTHFVATDFNVLVKDLFIATMVLYYGCSFLYFDWTEVQPY